MATITQLVTATTQDGYENGGTWNQDGDGSNYDYVGSGYLGFVFPSITLAATDKITSATIDLYGFGSSGNFALNMIIRGVAESNCAVFQLNGSNKPSTRSLTIRGAHWGPTIPFSLARRSTSDISSIVQEITSLPGWASGNNMGFIIRDLGVSSGENMAVRDFTGSAVDCAQITINYTAGTYAATGGHYTPGSTVSSVVIGNGMSRNEGAT